MIGKFRVGDMAPLINGDHRMDKVGIDSLMVVEVTQTSTAFPCITGMLGLKKNV